MTEVAALQLNGIGKVFAGLPVLKNIDLSVSKGEIICLVGRSGCGKSTLLRIIAGVETPDAGSVRMNGTEIAGPSGSSNRKSAASASSFRIMRCFPI